MQAALPDEQSLIDLLTQGEMDVVGRLSDASNATLFCRIRLDGVRASCVYKPVAGERPLWDFPARTLARREVAAYRLAVGTGWRLVPATVLREGPFGAGSVQWWVESGEVDADGDPMPCEPGGGVIDVLPPDRLPPGWMPVLDAEGRNGRPVVLAHAEHETLRRMAVFDIVANNTDRKGGHILRHAGGALLGVDHGLTFNTEDKLRTVLWGWAGRRLDADAREGLDRVATDLAGDSALRRDLRGLLSAREVARTAERAAALRAAGRYPRPAGGWPAIPWPAF